MNALRVPMKKSWRMTGALLITAASMVAASGSPAASAQESKCASLRPDPGFYEAGRKASAPITVPSSSCSTISVSHIKDIANPTDRCQTFLVGFFLPEGDVSYTEPVTACSEHLQTRTVLAWGVPDGVVYRVLYQVEYIEPEFQTVTYKVWH